MEDAAVSSLAQVDCAPTPQLALGLVALRQSFAGSQQGHQSRSLEGDHTTGEASTSLQEQPHGPQRPRWMPISSDNAPGRPWLYGSQQDSLGITGVYTPMADSSCLILNSHHYGA